MEPNTWLQFLFAGRKQLVIYLDDAAVTGLPSRRLTAPPALPDFTTLSFLNAVNF